ncbi:hypothetical protein ACVW17_007567 [Bradyrhizobium sp. USDA 4473]
MRRNTTSCRITPTSATAMKATMKERIQEPVQVLTA